MQLKLQLLWVGIGCQRGTSQQLIDRAIGQVFRENQLAENAIAGIATIDTKASEVGLIELCRLRNLPLITFSSEILSAVCVPNPAKITQTKVGTPSVAEAAAILAASQFTPTLIASFFAGKKELGVKFLVPKQIFRLEGEPGAVTIAVSQESRRFSPNSKFKIQN